MRAMLVTKQILLRVCSPTTKRWTSWQVLFSKIKVSCHIINEDSSHERGVSVVHPDSQECSIQLCCGEKRLTPLEPSVFWFLADRDDKAFNDER